MTHPECQFCHTWGGDCRITICLGCQTPVCMSHGSRQGTCPVCLFGGLPGWSRISGQTCSYAGCKHPAVFFYVPRKPRVCAAHANQVKVTRYNPMRKVSLLEFVQERVGEAQLRFLRRDCPEGEAIFRKLQEAAQKALVRLEEPLPCPACRRTCLEPLNVTSEAWTCDRCNARNPR